MSVAVILPAAGLGTRMGRTSPEKAGVSRKQFMLLDGSPIFLPSVGKIAKCPSVAKIRNTLPRERLVLAQTPQVFRFDLLRRAFQAARTDGFTGTDESSLVERLEEVEVSVVLGSDRNIKITKPTDMELARLFAREE